MAPFFRHHSQRLKPLALSFWQRHRRLLTLLFSGLSVLWGIISGISLSRDYAQSTRLIGYMALFVVASVLFRIWLEYARRMQERRDFEQAAAQRRIVAFMIERPALVEGVAFFATQVAVQYIAMFCLPLLFLAHAWVSLSLAFGLVLVSLIDPWWAWLCKKPLAMAGVRCFVAVIATSFSFAVFFPTALAFFYPCLAVVAALSALPWDLAVARRRPVWRDGVPGALIAALIVAALLPRERLRVPLLSVWLEQPGLGLGVEEHELGERWEDTEPQFRLAEALSKHDRICCLTPVVSPSGVDAALTHEWLIDDQVVDRIELPPIRGYGKGKGKAFRTYSCKQHVSAKSTGAVIHRLGCRAYLSGTIYLGGADVVFADAPAAPSPSSPLSTE